MAQQNKQNGNPKKNYLVYGIIALVIVVVGAALFVMRQRNQLGNGDSTTTVLGTAPLASSEPAANGSAPTTSISTGTTTATTAQEKKMNYDLTPDAEGLSKAVATMTLEKGGVIKFRFYTNDAPNTVKRITQLISEGFYNGIIFHRVVPGFVVQAGDPTGTGTSGSGVKLKAEFNKRKHEPGILSMARTADPNSADSQFFIMLGTHPHLDGQYTVFGKTIEGLDNVMKIQQGDKIKSWTIE